MLTTATGTMSQEQKALNVEEWESAIAILDGAKAEILERGWQQGSTDPLSVESCMSTALERSWSNLDKTIVDFEYARMALDNVLDMPAMEAVLEQQDPLSVPYWGRKYVYWNDASGRTKDEIVDAFSRAIGFAEDQKELAVKAKLTEDDILEFDRKAMQSLGLIK